MLTDKRIEIESFTDTTYQRGCQYYRQGLVKQLSYTPDNTTFKALVQGQSNYRVQIQFDKNQEIEDYHCNCQAFATYYGACKHVIAVLKTIQDQWSHYFNVQKAKPAGLSPATQKLLDFFQDSPTQARQKLQLPSQASVKLQPLFAFSLTQQNRPNAWLEFSIGQDRLYIVKDIPQLLTALENNTSIVYGKSFTLNPRTASFDPFSADLLKLLQEAWLEEQQRSIWTQSKEVPDLFSASRCFRLTPTYLDRFFELMGSKPFACLINYQKIDQLEVRPARPPIKATLQTDKNGLILTLTKNDDSFYVLDNHYRYIYYQESIYKVDDQFSSYLKVLLPCLEESKEDELYIPPTAMTDFVSTVLPPLEEVLEVEVNEGVRKQFIREDLTKKIYLDKFGLGVCARIEFYYGPVLINPAEGLNKHYKIDNKWLLRNKAEENELMELFRRHHFILDEGTLFQPDESETYFFLQYALPELQDLADIYYSEDFKQIKVKQVSPITAGVRLNETTNLLEFSFQYEELSTHELLDLLSSYKLKKRYHRLADGSFIPLDSPGFHTTAELMDELGLNEQDLMQPVIELPKYRALYLDSLARENSEFQLSRNAAFKQMIQDILEPQTMDYELPTGLQGKLRDYQKTGFKWLKSLAHYGLGGILADDMGLGKTLQVLTFLLSENQSNPLPSLVVAPTSLIYNWQEEGAKFAPSLKIVVISGLQEERWEQLQKVEEGQLLVTSYGLLRRDIDLYKQKDFQYCFLDEAQHIKNPHTLSAKSVKKIRAKSYFALTGTPIENTLTELWSIFDYLMPGYLHSHQTFVQNFEAPIVKNKDASSLKKLSLHIKPFILRRMKKMVLKELPEKIETKLTNTMTEEQTKVYAAWLLQARQQIEQELKMHGFEKSQIKILALLTRLRQICCHPALFIDNYQGNSGKLELLLEVLEDAINSGRRILIFSQFTTMLGLIKTELEAKGLSYFYLDGSTKAEDRIQKVKAFNKGEKELFLISLKAGGTGLNLTGADMVIHYDPWWNPAVEDQATDRAYRLGQHNSVQVYKLITKNTIEEQIYNIQQKKKELIDTLIKPGETFLTKMNEAEIRELFQLN